LIGLFCVVWFLVRRQTLARQQTLLEVNRKADALKLRTEEIAAEVERRDRERTDRIAHDIEKLGHLFDNVGVQQREMKASIKSVDEVMHRELGRAESDRTTRQQIDEIQSTTETIAEKLNGTLEKPKE